MKQETVITLQFKLTHTDEDRNPAPSVNRKRRKLGLTKKAGG